MALPVSTRAAYITEVKGRTPRGPGVGKPPGPSASGTVWKVRRILNPEIVGSNPTWRAGPLLRGTIGV